MSTNEQGFTLIEAVVAFAIFLMIVSLFPLFVAALLMPNNEKQFNHLEVTVFFNQVAMEIREANGISMVNNRLLLNKGEQIVSYDQHGSRMRRQVNGAGHEIVLQNVTNVQFKLVHKGVIISVTDKDGRNYRRRISMMMEAS